MTAPAEPRTPPRFVPTLTEVVNVSEGQLSGLLPHQRLPASPAAGHAEPWPSARLEPSMEPLPDPWVAPESKAEVALGEVFAEALEAPVAATLSAEQLAGWADQVTGRVIEQLERRLPAVLAEHARLLSLAAAQELRKELPLMVHEAVQASLASAEPIRLDATAQSRFSNIAAADANAG